MKNKILLRFFGVILITIINNLSLKAQQDGFLDVTFNTGSGLQPPPHLDFDNQANFIVPYSDSTYLIGGRFTSYGGNACNRLILVDSNFNFIPSFSLSGISFINQLNDAVVLPNGQILIVGNFSYSNYSFPNTGQNICRLYSDGTIDTTFHSPILQYDGEIRCIDTLSNGQIMIGGYFRHDWINSNYLVRINSDGSIDNTFSSYINQPTSGVGYVEDLKIQTDGKLIIVGNFSQINFNDSKNIARLNPNGNLDPSFLIGNGFNEIAFDLVLENTGKIYVGGYFSSYDTTNISGLVRLNTDGSIDAGYLNNIGLGFTSTQISAPLVTNIEYCPDGKLIITGGYEDFNGLSNRFIRLNNDGTIDSSSIESEIAIGGYIRDLTIFSDGRIIYLGSSLSHSIKDYFLSETYSSLLVVYNNGHLDRRIHYKIGPANGQPITTNSINTFVDLNNGYVILGGIFTTYNNVECYGLAKIDYAGNLDTSFHCPIKGQVTEMLMTSDSSIIAIGKFVHEDFLSNQLYMVKFHQDGSIDSNFNPPVASIILKNIDLYPDGRIIALGNFSGLKRYLSNGALDPSFVSTLPNSGGSNDVKVINQNQLIVTGSFTQWNNQNRKYVVMLDNNCALLPITFPSVFFPNTAMGAINLDPVNGLIYLSSEYNTNLYVFDYSATQMFPITLGCGSGQVVKVQPDNKYLLHTCFTYDGFPGNAIFRANLDGSIDLTYNSSAPLGNYGPIGKTMLLNQGFILANRTVTTTNTWQSSTLQKLYYATPAIMPFSATGQVYKDMNSNSIFESGIDYILNYQLIYENGIPKASTNYSGDYTVYTDDTLTQLSPLNPNPTIPYYTLTPTNYSLDFSSASLIQNNDFIYQPIPGMNDLEVYATLQSPIRIGEGFLVDFLVKNVGTTTLAPILNITKDSLNQVNSSFPAYFNYSGNLIQIQVDTLLPNQQNHVKLYMSSPISGYSIGDSVLISCSLTYTGAEQTPVNNSDSLITIVYAAYDPNIKEVSKDIIQWNTINNSTYLDYTIHFQNTGNSPAINIFIKDTLSSYLDISSMEILSSSDSMYLSINQFNNQAISFNFPNIMLPDSTSDELNSHGFVKYRIKLINPTNIPVNSLINNTAYIFFDFNQPVVTNTASTLIYSPLGINSISKNDERLRLYPNPNEGQFTIQLLKSEISKIEITNGIGQLVETINGNGTSNQTINLEAERGIYFATVIDKKGVKYITKIIKH